MSPPAVGERLGRYLLDEDLGQGALGPVFSATDSRNDRKVLVRSVGPALMEDRGLWRKLREAAQRVRRLDHPVPAQVVDVVDTPQAKAIIEERVDGHSLGQELDHRGGQLPLHRAYAVFVRIAEAVQAAHDQDLPHWRLNPQAVVLSRTDNKEQVRITGFGVGLALTESGGSAVAATKDMPVHLAYYLAPEQAHRGMTPSPQSDVYALGVMLYEALTGYVPFGGDDVYSVVRGHLMDPPPPPRSLVPDLPWHVEAVVLRALAKHPDDRLKSPRELALYLRGCASGAVIPSPPDAPSAGMSGPQPATTPSAADTPAPPTANGAGVRVRRQGPPSPPAITPLPLPPPTPLPSPSPMALPVDPSQDDDDVPTAVRTVADFDDDDHEPTNPSLPIIDEADLILIDPAEAGFEVDTDSEIELAPAQRETEFEDIEEMELPEGVPNPSYLALLTPRG